MQRKNKNVLYIDSEPSFLEQQKQDLKFKELDEHLYSFNNINEAFEFMEDHIIERNHKLHYIILNEKVVGQQLSNYLEKIWGLNEFLKRHDVIVITDNNNTMVRNKVMQYPFVSVYLVKPVPNNYIEFLITGQIA